MLAADVYLRGCMIGDLNNAIAAGEKWYSEICYSDPHGKVVANSFVENHFKLTTMD